MIETEGSRRAFEKATGRVLRAPDAPRGKPLVEVLVPDFKVEKGAVTEKMDRPFSGQEAICERCTEILKARGVWGMVTGNHVTPMVTPEVTPVVTRAKRNRAEYMRAYRKGKK